MDIQQGLVVLAKPRAEGSKPRACLAFEELHCVSI